MTTTTPIPLELYAQDQFLKRKMGILKISKGRQLTTYFRQEYLVERSRRVDDEIGSGNPNTQGDVENALDGEDLT